MHFLFSIIEYTVKIEDVTKFARNNSSLIIRRDTMGIFGKKKKDKLFVRLQSIAAILRESTQYFYDFKINEECDLTEFMKTMKSYEEKGDEEVHAIIKELNSSFITPIEREDILHIAMHMDDILDGLDECATLFEMYNINKVNDYMVKFSEYINMSAIEIYECIELLSQKKLMGIREHLIKIKDYESACDVLERQGIKELLTTHKDNIIELVEYKEIYKLLEEVADQCQDVANVFETIIMKNA